MEEINNTEEQVTEKTYTAQEVEALKDQIQKDIEAGVTNELYSSEEFYMGDPDFFDSFVGLYFGDLAATSTTATDGTVVVHWRAECPWEWPSYEEMMDKHGTCHAQNFKLPNARSVLFGKKYALGLDDGLGGHLETGRS